MTEPTLRLASPEMHALWEQSAAEVDRVQIELTLAKSAAAAAEDSFSGFVRRCVRQGGRPVSLLADEAHVDLQRLAHFLQGEGSLDTTEIDRLLSTLGVEVLASGRIQ